MMPAVDTSILQSSLLQGGVPLLWRPRPVRIGVVIGIVTAISLLAMAISNKLFDVNGWARGLYWLHDYVYLVIKGHVWTLYYPYSLVWCVPFVLVICLAVINFCTHRSVFHSAHVYFTQRCLRFGLTTRLLKLWCALIGRYNWGWQQILSVVEFELETAFDDILVGRRDKRYLKQAELLGRLYGDMALSISSPKHRFSTECKALELLFELLVLILLIDEKCLDTVDKRLLKRLTLLIERLDPKAGTEHYVGRPQSSALELIHSLINDISEPTLKDSMIVLDQSREIITFVNRLEKMQRHEERQRRRRHNFRPKQVTQENEDFLRLRFLHAVTISKVAAQYSLAQIVLNAIEGHLLVRSLNAVPRQEDTQILRSRDFSYLSTLINDYGRDEFEAFVQIAEDPDVFNSDDLDWFTHQLRLIEQSVGTTDE